MPDPVPTLSIAALFNHADIIVKGVLVLLLAASVWSWAVIINKIWRLGGARRSVRTHEARIAAAHSAADLAAPSGRPEGSDPAGIVLSAGWDETAAASPAIESSGERRERIERAMRFALGAELRRLEVQLPFLATLGSAAPFIGLFGTVWGIMRSFTAIAAAHNTSLAVVGPGIAEALFATAMGLAAAIPAVVAYNKFVVDLGRFAGHMNGLIGRCAGILARTPRGS